MSTSKLKELLHRRIDQLEDPQDIFDAEFFIRSA